MDLVTTEFRIRGRDFRLKLPDGDHILKQVTAARAFYEWRLLYFLLDHGVVNRDSVVVDVGAHVGNHTVFFGSFCGQVFAFEPCELSYRNLLENVKLNGLTNVDAADIGVGAVDGIMESTFVVPRNSGSLCWWYEGAPGAPKVAGLEGLELVKAREKAKVKRLDGLMGSDRVDFIKIDAQGMELEVLQGASEIIRTRRPTIMVEVWPPEHGDGMKTWMQAAGYEHFPVPFPDKVVWLLRPAGEA
jgi:FkbM family methyltransferase